VDLEMPRPVDPAPLADLTGLRPALTTYTIPAELTGDLVLQRPA
jgi:hypothetical protein